MPGALFSTAVSVHQLSLFCWRHENIFVILQMNSNCGFEQSLLLQRFVYLLLFLFLILFFSITSAVGSGLFGFFFLFFFCNSVLNNSSSTVCQCEEAVHCDRQPLWDNSSSVSKQSTENDGSSSILQTIRTAWDNQARPWRCPVEEQGWWSQPRVTDLRRIVSEMQNWKSWLAAEFGDILQI